MGVSFMYDDNDNNDGGDVLVVHKVMTINLFFFTFKWLVQRDKKKFIIILT